jgi:hypothetical protein
MGGLALIAYWYSRNYRIKLKYSIAMVFNMFSLEKIHQEINNKSTIYTNVYCYHKTVLTFFFFLKSG